MFVALSQRLILTIKVTLRTFWTYEQHLRTKFMDLAPRIVITCIYTVVESSGDSTGRRNPPMIG